MVSNGSRSVPRPAADGQGSLVVVTGGSRGIGLAISRALLDAGYWVVIIARHRNEEIDSLLRVRETQCGFEAWDLSEIDKLHDLALMLRVNYGSVYGLINNAGIGPGGILAMMGEAEIGRIMQLNILSPIILTKYLSRHMLASGSGRIINISSIVATQGYKGLAAYSASKAAMLGFSQSLARELGEAGDITVNAITPGFIATEMTHGLTEPQRAQIARRSALHRLATADDVAQAVVYLMTAKNVTGTTLTVDAGNTA